MRSLASFATAEFPLHPSGLNVLVECPWRAAMIHLLTGAGDEGGPAADTGSAMHLAAATLHRGSSIADSIEAMGEGIRKYPQADLGEAAAMFLKYASDSRNTSAKLLLVEEPVEFSIAPHRTDPTGAPISVIGTVDQVREDEHGRLWVTDIKTSRKDPIEVMNKSTFQLAAYCVGAAQKLNRKVHGAQILMPRKYGADPSRSPVFWPYTWGWDDLEQILLAIRKRVAEVRAGDLYHVPNGDCKWCHCRTPDVCLPALREHKKMNLQLA